MESIKNTKKGIILIGLGFLFIGYFSFLLWLDSPGEVEFYLNRNSERVYNETDTLQQGQEYFYRFVQLQETEAYQITIINKETDKIYETFTIDVPIELREETVISGKHRAPLGHWGIYF